MPDTSKMTPEEYAAFTGKMSHPVGEQQRSIDFNDQQVRAVQSADYVQRFVRHLEDPAIRLVTEKPHDWTSWGEEGKAAILAALKNAADVMSAKIAGNVAITAAATKNAVDYAKEAVEVVRKTMFAEAEKELCDFFKPPEAPCSLPKGHFGAHVTVNYGPAKCVEPGCDRTGTHKYGTHPYCKEHFDAIPF